MSELDRFPLEATEQSIPARFSAIAAQHADRTAISTRARRVSYREFQAHAARIAGALRAAGEDAAAPVAIFTADDATLVAAMFGVLEAGRVFVVLDPAQPDERAAAVREDAGAGAILTDADLAARAHALVGRDAAVIDAGHLAPPSPGAGAAPVPTADSPACIVYTSGSTGRPRGVVQTHRNLLHNIFVHTNALRIAPDDRLTLLSARATGQALTGIFSALLNGAALHPFDVRREGLTALADWLAADRITIYHSSASVFRQLAATLAAESRGARAFPDLRVIKLGSEPVARQDLDHARALFPRECLFVNALSSSETLTIRQTLIAHDTPVAGSVVPVGQPVHGMEVVLLDDDGAPAAPGAAGTICVRSRYLSPGYWRDDAATRAAFFTDGEGRRCFRTGDLGRFAPDGSLEYLGRADFRVKIRGHRVEVAEVEAAIREFPAVAHAVVVGQNDGRGGTRLVAYVVPLRAAPPPSASSLRAFLRAKLPAHMVPGGFVFLDELPMTPGLKVDRRALPPWTPVARGAESAPAREDLRAAQLAAIWEELLGVSGIGPRDDFFELGGDSLLAVEMAVKVEEAFGTRVRLQDLAPDLTIDALARALDAGPAARAQGALVTLRAGGGKHPFVLVHGDLECGGFYARGLARHLDPDRPVYAIHPHGLDGTPVPTTIEAMAADRLALLNRIPGHEHCVLAGYCCGGAVAVEMARLLRRREHAAHLVVLIDARAENAPYRTAMKCLRVLVGPLHLAPQVRRKLYRRVRVFLAAFGEASARGPFAAAGFLLGKPVAMLARLGNAPRRNRSAPPAGASHRSPAFQALWTAHHDVLQEYIPGPLPVRMVLMRSSHLDDKTPRDEAAGWRQVARDVAVRRIPGDHATCVTRHVAALAREIESVMGD